MPGADSNSGTDPLSALRARLQSLGSPRLQKALTPLIDSAAGDVTRARANIEEWYNSSMDRVSGWYKRRSHITVLILGFVVAVAVNADSFLIVRRLASDRALAISLGAPFWFDVLNKIIVIRSTVKPKEKSQEDKSKD